MSQQPSVPAVIDAEFMPAMSVEQVSARYTRFHEFVKHQLVDGRDFGKVPGTDKPSLQKPGAEKLATFFGLCVQPPRIVEKIEDWTGKDHGGEPFFNYLIEQSVTRHGEVIASQLASANSWESKWRWRWVAELEVPSHLDKTKLARRDGAASEFEFAIKAGETGGKYGKPAEYWKRFRDAIENKTARRIKKRTKAGKELDAWEIGSIVFRVPNEDVFSQVNTIIKIAQKRAFVAAVLIAVNGSDYFTQDVEDAADHGGHAPSAPASAPRDDDDHHDHHDGGEVSELVSQTQAKELKEAIDALPPDSRKHVWAEIKRLEGVEKLTQILAANFAEVLAFVQRARADSARAGQLGRLTDAVKKAGGVDDPTVRDDVFSITNGRTKELDDLTQDEAAEYLKLLEDHAARAAEGVPIE